MINDPGFRGYRLPNGNMFGVNNDGGAGSGNFGHSGRPGEQGGSGESGSGTKDDFYAKGNIPKSNKMAFVIKKGGRFHVVQTNEPDDNPHESKDIYSSHDSLEQAYHSYGALRDYW